MTPLVRLNLSFPPALEMAITEALVSDPRLPGFTLLHAEGHTSDFSHASAHERVRGYIDRRVLWMIMESGTHHQVLALLRPHVAAKQVRWWLESVLEGGWVE